MRISPSFAATMFAAFMFVASTARGQNNLEGLYCNAGLHPDGYIDLSGLPPSPTPQSTTPITAILPVVGVQGLTATVSILPVSNGSVPQYTVNGGHLQFSNLQGTGTLLTLTFNQPVKGVGLTMENTSGRFTYSYNLQVGDGTAPYFSNTASGFTIDEFTERSENLQLVALDRSFPEAAVQFSGDLSEGNGSPMITNIRVQSTAAPDPASSVPTNGLQMWLPSVFANVDGNTATTWPDRSGNGHDATAPSGQYVEILNDTHTCQPAFAFNGSTSFNFNLPIAGWNEMTVFMVASSTQDPPDGTYDSFNAGILWTENAYWGNTFVSPYQSHVFARFGTTQPNTNLEYVRPGGGIGEDFSITRAVHNNDTDSIYVNGTQVFSQAGNNPVLGGTTGDGTIGAGFNGNYNGEIGEILVYNRVLSDQESAQVESYLRRKFGIE